jgi:hypothetical protein
MNAKWAVLILAGSFGIAVLLCWWLYSPKLAKGVTRAGLLALRPGMSENEIVKLIGEPLYKRRMFGAHPIGQKSQWTGEWAWIYGEQGLFGFYGGLEISVGIEHGRLVSAGAERYDLGVWWCKPRQCPVVWDQDALAELRGR